MSVLFDKYKFVILAIYSRKAIVAVFLLALIFSLPGTAWAGTNAYDSITDNPAPPLATDGSNQLIGTMNLTKSAGGGNVGATIDMTINGTVGSGDVTEVSLYTGSCTAGTIKGSALTGTFGNGSNVSIPSDGAKPTTGYSICVKLAGSAAGKTVGITHNTDNSAGTSGTPSSSNISIAAADTDPPTPNPMTWSSAPANASATQIDMTSTTGSDATGPISYEFALDNSGCGANAGTGGNTRTWATGTTYSDTGLQPNQCYGYTVQARDAVGTPNTGTASAISSTYTSANTPGQPTLGSPTTTTLALTNAENSNPASNPTTYFAVQVILTTPTDATWDGMWVNGSGSPSASAVWLTDAQLDALVLGSGTALTASTQYDVQVKARNNDTDETALSTTGSGTTSGAAPPSTITTCTGCHNMPPAEAAARAAASRSVVGSHAVTNHDGANCVMCHIDNGTASDTYPQGLGHREGLIEMSATIHNQPGSSYSKGTSFSQTASASLANLGTCSTTWCHGGTSDVWGTDLASYDHCTICHGVKTVGTDYTATASASMQYKRAPGADGVGVDTASQTGSYTSNVSDDSQVGAHDVHLRGIGGYASGAALTVCTDCHTVSAVSDANHMSGSTTFTWSTKVTSSGALSPSYAGGGGACTNTYCHGNAFPAAVKGTDLAPTWTGGTYLANPAASKNSTDCNKCHVSPPTSSAKFAHTAMTIATNCTTCHNHNGTGATHINGILYGAGDCDSCHSFDVVGATYASSVWTGGTWGSGDHQDSPTNEGWGAHAVHINHIKTKLVITGALSPTGQTFGTGDPANVCGTCHTNTAGNHQDTSRQILFGDATYKYGGAGGTSFVFGASNPAYNGASGVSSGTTPKTCSNVSCHFSTTPTWSAY